MPDQELVCPKCGGELVERDYGRYGVYKTCQGCGNKTYEKGEDDGGDIEDKENR